jgi:hypothetical protein
MADAEQVLVACDLACEVVSSEQVSAALARSVCKARIRGVQPLERRREAGVGDLHDRVVVRSHQRVGDNCDLKVLERPGQLCEEAQALGVGLEQEACVARPGSDVVQARIERASAAGHLGKRMSDRFA